MSHIYVNLIDEDSAEGGSASEGDYRSEESDGLRNTSTVAPSFPEPIVIVPSKTPKKRGRPPKAVTEVRLSALYHGASTIESKGSNGTPGSFDGAQATPTPTPKKRGRPRKSESEKINIGPKSKIRKIAASSPSLSTEATQGSSRESSDEVGGFPMVEEFLPRGRPLARGRGHPLMAGSRYNPFDRALGGVPSYGQGLYPAADPYAAAAYASAYGAMDYARDLYALALAAPVLVPRAPRAAPAAASAAASGTSDTIARQLLNLYIKDSSSFDKFAKNPLIQESLELDAAQDEEDPYYRPPKEYYEAKSATLTSSFRGSGLDDTYGAGDGYAAIPRCQPLLSVGSSRSLVGAGLPAPRSLSFIGGGGALMGHRPLGAPVMRPRLPPPRPANLYTSFE